MRIVYAIGNGVHLWIQNSDDVIVSPKVGWWECLACGHTFWSTGYPDIDCPKCGARKRALRYKEHSLSLSAPYQSTGHPDLFIQVGNYVRVVEIKTIAGDAFGKLYAPFIEHQWQLQYYMWGCSEDTKLPVQVDPYVGYCVYVSKVPNWKSIPYKMFVVEKNTNVLQSVKRKLLEFNDILSDAGFGRMHNECVADFECSRAKWCSVRKYCTEFREAGL